jgi:hypothetical protein
MGAFHPSGLLSISIFTVICGGATYTVILFAVERFTLIVRFRAVVSPLQGGHIWQQTHVTTFIMNTHIGTTLG